MTRDLSTLTGRTFDLVVVGAGITGACLAHDATLRGLSVALVDRADFGAATSAASSKLLHGGVRYLQQLQLLKVRESAVERLSFIRVAPHLVRWVPFLIPTSRSIMRGRLALGAGLLAARALQLGQGRALTDPSRMPPGEYALGRRDLVSRYPLLRGISGLTGAWVLHEAHMGSSERMTLAFVKTAAAGGAAVANYVEVTRFLRGGEAIVGVEAVDRLSGRQLEIAGRVVANAAGPWIGVLNSPLEEAHLKRDVTGYSKGVHLVTRELLDDVAVAIPTTHRSQAIVDRLGRHFFVIPWRGCSLIGTANVPFSASLDTVRPTSDDITGFLADLNLALPGVRLARDDVRYAFAGLYPLTEPVIRPEIYQGTGQYQLVDHARVGGPPGLVSVLGAKYTTARRLAERATDMVMAKLRRRAVPCATRTTPLVGGDIDDLPGFAAQARQRLAGRLGADVVDHLVGHYGREIDAVVATSPDMASARLVASQATVEAEIRYAVDHEMAVHLDDVVFRRTGLGTLGPPGNEALWRAAAIAAESLGWDDERRRDEVRRVAAYFEYP